MNLEVFVHKSEALSEEYKIGASWYLFALLQCVDPMTENFRHIQQRVLDELLDLSPEYEQVPMNFYLTSIYDHSLHDAFSRVLHKLIDSLPYIEDLLNVFCGVSPDPNIAMNLRISMIYRIHHHPKLSYLI